MEEAGNGATPEVLKETLAAFKNEMLKEHLWPQARSQLNEAWSAYPSANPSKVAKDRPEGLVMEVPTKNIKWNYTQTGALLCTADSSQ